MVHVRAFAWQGSLVMSLLAAGVAVGCGRSELDLLEISAAVDAGDELSDVDGSAPGAPPVEAAAPPTPPADPCADLPPIPCPGGGYKYCVAGSYSDCPKRCSVCVPGSRRVCLIAYCNYWGTQTCTADGQSFGYCVEGSVPPLCQAIADASHSSPALEQCCLDHGYCCKDTFDLNHNGDTGDQIGQCSSVTCN
jgi:hypothetical protein